VRQRHPRPRGRTRRRTCCRGGAGTGCGCCAGGGQKRIRCSGQACIGQAATRGAAIGAWERRDHGRPFERECGHGRSLTRRSLDRRSVAGPAITGRDICPAAQLGGCRGGPPSPPRPRLHAHERSHAWGMDKASRLMRPHHIRACMHVHVQHACVCICSAHACSYSAPAVENGAWPECCFLSAWERVVSQNRLKIQARGSY
jgi:hypothetical protein